MKTVLLNGMNNPGIANALCARLDNAGQSCTSFHLNDLDIKPCRSCGTCGHKTPGECAVKDDITPILRAVANCDTIIMLTPVMFGGYSAALKKAVDKFMVLGEAMYAVKKGHMVHPMRYGKKHIIAVGVEKKRLDDERESFQTLVAHNALNMDSTHQTVFTSQDSPDYQRIASAVCEAAL